MDVSSLERITRDAAALRTRNRLQPAGGPDDVVYPPTYGEGSTRHERRIDGQSVPCVLLDSVTSQANRIELALRDAGVGLAHVAVEVEGRRVTCFDAPHRVCDAIFRGCSLDGQPYLQSALGQALLEPNLPELFGCSPASFLFGFWHSNRTGGVGIRVPRSLAAELVAVNAADAPHTQSRIDPLPISKATNVERVRDPERVASEGWDWRLGGNGKPSDSLLGNIPPTIESERGVTMDYAMHTGVISLASLRSLQLGEHTDDARILLAAMGVAGFVLAFGNGCRLRSRADLVPEASYEWEAITGPNVETLGTLSADEATGLLRQAAARYAESGAPWREETRLEPSDDLVGLVRDGWIRQGMGG